MEGSTTSVEFQAPGLDWPPCGSCHLLRCPLVPASSWDSSWLITAFISFQIPTLRMQAQCQSTSTLSSSEDGGSLILGRCRCRICNVFTWSFDLWLWRTCTWMSMADSWRAPWLAPESDMWSYIVLICLHVWRCTGLALLRRVLWCHVWVPGLGTILKCRPSLCAQFGWL